MDYTVRHSIKIILLNETDELLLISIDDPRTKGVGEDYRGPFWNMIGGQIEAGESVLEAATRELFEETGISEKDVRFGPIVWYGEYDLILNGTLTHIKQQFIVARTKQRTFSLANLTEAEAKTVKQLAYFSLHDIINGGEIIYPILLPDYLPDIISGKYPEEPIEINLAATVRISLCPTTALPALM